MDRSSHLPQTSTATSTNETTDGSLDAAVDEFASEDVNERTVPASNIISVGTQTEFEVYIVNIFPCTSTQTDDNSGSDGVQMSQLIVKNQTLQEENGKLKAQIKKLEKELLSVKIKNTVLENEKQLHVSSKNPVPTPRRKRPQSFGVDSVKGNNKQF